MPLAVGVYSFLFCFCFHSIMVVIIRILKVFLIICSIFSTGTFHAHSAVEKYDLTQKVLIYRVKW